MIRRTGLLRGRAFFLVWGSLALSAVSCGSGGSVDSTTRGVPWSNEPGTLFAASTASRACTPPDFTAAPLGNGVWHGQVTEDLDLTQAGSSACTLQGPPTTLLSRDGVPSVSVMANGAGTSVTLVPGQHVQLILGCDSGGSSNVSWSASLSIDGAPLTVTSVVLPPACANADFVAFQPQDPPLTPAGLSALAISTSLPPSTSRGQALHYQITLTNPTTAAIAFNPCPSYTETLSQPEPQSLKKHSEVYLVNCPSAPSELRPGASTTLQMILSVPSDWQAGPAKFLWRLEVEGYPAAGGVVQLT